MEHVDVSTKIDPKDGTFHFDCGGSGSCCRGEIDIRLNLADLHRMVQFLNLETTGALFQNGIVRKMKLAQGGFRPAIQFKKAGILFCPFLENRLTDENKLKGICTMHAFGKPLVCALAPLGREIEIISDTEGELINEVWFFTEPIRGCEGCLQQLEHYTADWISVFADQLRLETQYFGIMNGMQQRRANEAVYESFHSELKNSEVLSGYLEDWCKRIGIPLTE